MRRWTVGRLRHLLFTIACVVCLSACAARIPPRPAGPSTPDPTATEAFRQATKGCAGLRTLTVELRLAGRAGDERLRGTLHAGFEGPAAVRVEALAPFGQPFFILAGRDNRATLLLPRDDSVLRDAPVAQILERLTGLSLGADDLRLILTGCLSEPANPTDPRGFGDAWRAVTLGTGIVAYLKPVNRAPAVVAADHGEWRVDYSSHLNGWPRQVRIRSVAGHVDLTASLGELEINAGIDPRAFEIVIPATAAPMTLDHLRSVAPLKATR
jgi:outer membrane biogenesis lipoprotein LolB